MKRNLLVISVMPLVLTAAVFAGVNASTAQSPASSAQSLAGGSGPGGSGPGSSVTCDSGPGAGSAYPCVPDRLYGVAGTSASDVWAVGLDPSGSMALHWNGSAWTEYHPAQDFGFLRGVAASGPGDAWTVGGTNWFSPVQTLAMHWDGTSWTRVATPNPGGGAFFNAVSVTCKCNAWAVGLIQPGGPGVTGPATPLIEQWDGSTWSVQQFQQPSGGGVFQAVAATSLYDAWAVGWTGGTNESAGQATLIEHWNGSSWTIVPSPDPGSSSYLSGVTAISPNDAWAVGHAVSSGGTDESLIMHWDGSTWTQVPSPSPAGDTTLHAVAAAASDDVWATGVTNGTRCGNGGAHCQGVIMHWDGTSWAVMPSPNPPGSYLNDYLGVTALRGEDAWAVGTTDYAWTLIAHWNGTAWN